jgi:hypothetical protein
MWWSILYHTILCIVIVALGHFIWETIQTQYTSPTRPSGEKQSQKYKEIISQLQTQQTPPTSPPIGTHITTGEYDYISPEDKQAMMEELKSLLMEGL